jgi:hypothetical protein
MGRNKRSEEKLTENETHALSNRPFSNITAATTNNAGMAECKGKKKARNKDKVDSGEDKISCTSKPVKTHQCSLPDSDNALVSGMKKCSIAEKSNPKKKKQQAEDQELQNLLDFIEGKDSSKENAVPNANKKAKKKKKKPQQTEANGEEGKESQAAVKENQSSEAQQGNGKGKDSGKNGKDKGAQKKDNVKGAFGSSDSSSDASEHAIVKPKKPKKAPKPPTKEELEVMQLLQYIEGPSTKDKQDSAAATENGNDSSDQNNNSSKKKKSKKKKPPKEFDFNALKDNTHLEAKMIEEILKNPTCVNEYRLFNPKQVAYLFSKGHNEHWEKHPECDGRLKPLERSREGLTLCDPGSKQLALVFAELRRARGKNITKRDLIDALKCQAYLQCAKCSYESEIVQLH